MTAIAFCSYEVVDEVMTLTLSAEPGEDGLVVHFMRATWEDDDHTHEVANDAGGSAETAVWRWSLQDRVLSVSFSTEAAAELGFEQTEVFELPADRAADVRRHLTEILVDVPEGAA
jgi:hypothetical protein